MDRKIETGWPAIGLLTVLIAGGLGTWLVVSEEAPEQFYKQWYLLIWGAGGLLALCVLAEIARLKCPRCRSRALTLLSAEEVDRWIGQKVVTEDTVSIGGFTSLGNPKFKGVNGSLATTRRTIPVTKRRLLQTFGCKTCGHQFRKNVVEEMD